MVEEEEERWRGEGEGKGRRGGGGEGERRRRRGRRGAHEILWTKVQLYMPVTIFFKPSTKSL